MIWLQSVIFIFNKKNDIFGIILTVRNFKEWKIYFKESRRIYACNISWNSFPSSLWIILIYRILTCTNTFNVYFTCMLNIILISQRKFLWSWSYQSWQFSVWLVGMCLTFNISCNSSYSLRSHEDGLGTIPCARVHSQLSSALIYIENKKYNFIIFSFYPFLIQQFMKTIYHIHVHDCMLFISILCKCIL